MRRYLKYRLNRGIDHSYEKSLNLSPASSPGDLSPIDYTEQLVNSTSKLVISMSELNLGMKGAFNFLFFKDYQFIFSNHGCDFIYFTEICPKRLLGSL